MVKSIAYQPDGAPVFVVRLSEEDATRLRDGRPLLVQLADFGPFIGAVVIHYDKTEVDIARLLSAPPTTTREGG